MCSNISKWLLLIPAEILGGLEYWRKLEFNAENSCKESSWDNQVQGETLDLRFVHLLLSNLRSRVLCECVRTHVYCLKQGENYSYLVSLVHVCKGSEGCKEL